MSTQNEPKAPWTVRWNLRDGAVIAALIGGVVSWGIYWSAALDERSQLRSDVRHLTDSINELRKDLDAQRLENKQLNDLYRQSQMDLATKDYRLAETEKKLSSTGNDAIAAKTEAEKYKALTASDKRCKPYRDEIFHLEAQLNMSRADVFSPKGEERKEALEALKRTKDTLDQCMGFRPGVSGN
ncbi:hypothetical protein AUC61_14525 [Pseudomonas sp. S25]|uniref:Prophage endopeptidase n=1 Tax=Pseudomonas maioricensis TaxID=1766623 RepID=A0ABS9ZJJ1_9PSED|nr:hypothetical protein [Pseudomonas sp. S25]MCI8210750.1 hypothetical protein [Pseudomonas sp. S25]